MSTDTEMLEELGEIRKLLTIVKIAARMGID